MGDDLLAGPRFGDLDHTAVRTHVVAVFGNIRRIVLEVGVPRVFDIDMHRVTESVQFPDARNRHRTPGRIVVRGAEEIARALIGVLHTEEFPRAVYRQETLGLAFVGRKCRGGILIGEERSVHPHSVAFVHGLILPLDEGLRTQRNERREGKTQGQNLSFQRVKISPDPEILQLCPKTDECPKTDTLFWI